MLWWRIYIWLMKGGDWLLPISCSINIWLLCPATFRRDHKHDSDVDWDAHVHSTTHLFKYRKKTWE